MPRTTTREYFASASPFTGRSYSDAPESFYMPTDGMVPTQWHLKNTGQTGGTAGIDINVSAVWDDYTGAGVSIGIYDDGVDFTHADLNDNYDTSQHLVLGGVTYSAMPSGNQY